MDCDYYNHATPASKETMKNPQVVFTGIYEPVSEEMFNVSDYTPTDV